MGRPPRADFPRQGTLEELEQAIARERERLLQRVSNTLKECVGLQRFTTVVDEGATIQAVLEILSLADTRSVKTAALLDKRERRVAPIELDYVGFPVERGWVIGYGMDVDGEYRDLDWIGILIDDRFE